MGNIKYNKTNPLNNADENKKKDGKARLKKKLKAAGAKAALYTAALATLGGVGSIDMKLMENYERKKDNPELTTAEKEHLKQMQKLEEEERQEERTYTAWADSVVEQHTQADEEYADSVFGEHLPDGSVYKKRLIREHALQRAEKENPEMAEKGKKVRAAQERISRIIHSSGGVYR